MDNRSGMSSSEIADVLEAVADGFESGTYGWVQGRYGNSVAGYCSVGAIMHVAKTETWYDVEAITGPIMNTLPIQDEDLPCSCRGLAANHSVPCWNDPEDLPCSCDGLAVNHSVPCWNDAEGRTKEQIIDKFKMVAKDLRNRVGAGTQSIEEDQR